MEKHELQICRQTCHALGFEWWNALPIKEVMPPTAST
jgi:hypothetical protein